ncbi:MAG: hypothetical protein ACM3PY_17535, partial [Omnitrophica WOR_2 bacterium]
ESGQDSQRIPRDKRKAERPPSYSWVLVLLVFFSTCLCAALCAQPQPVQGAGWLSVALHSLLAANYRVDTRGEWILPPGLGLILDVLWDEDPTSADQEYQQLLSQLKTPVASVTLGPGETPVQFSTRTPTPSPTSTSTPLPLTATATITPSPTATLTPTFTYIPDVTGTQEKQPTRPALTLTPGKTPTKTPTPTEPAPQPTAPGPTLPPYPPPYP